MSVEDALSKLSNGWAVVTDDHGQPLGALSRGELMESTPGTQIIDALGDFPKVVADAKTPLGALLDSPALLSTMPSGVIVAAMQPDGEHVERVVGVWKSDRLLNLGTAGSRLTSVGVWSLIGDVAIPRVVRRCRFSAAEKDCGMMKMFKEKPLDMPACPDPDRLGAHQFTW
jgi:hypothetical protein